MINVIIYSFDRACQLDLALRSIEDNFVEWRECKFNIICKWTNEEYKKGYLRVKELHKHPSFIFIQETNFKTDTLNAINNSNKKYTTWMMDDDAFIRPFSLNDEPFKIFEKDLGVSCLSPRLAPYMDYCYTQNRKVKVPVISENMTWDWRIAAANDLYHGYPSDWGYPMSIASFHVFRTSQITPIINSIPFKAPNSLEGHMALKPVPGNKMICYKEARNINIPINKVQTENNNRFGNVKNLQQDVLNSDFLKGKRISTNTVYYAVTPSPHFELDIVLE